MRRLGEQVVVHRCALDLGDLEQHRLACFRASASTSAGHAAKLDIGLAAYDYRGLSHPPKHPALPGRIMNKGITVSIELVLAWAPDARVVSKIITLRTSEIPPPRHRPSIPPCDTTQWAFKRAEIEPERTGFSSSLRTANISGRPPRRRFRAVRSRPKRHMPLPCHPYSKNLAELDARVHELVPALKGTPCIVVDADDKPDRHTSMPWE
jgi:hypothetical protein